MRAVVIDSTVWKDYFGGRTTPYTLVLDRLLLDDEAVVGDFIVTEVLRGFRSDKEYAQARAAFAVIANVELLGNGRSVRVADRYRHLRKRGVTIRKAVDCVIASYCLDEDRELLSADRDFRPYVKHFGLKLIQPPLSSAR